MESHILNKNPLIGKKMFTLAWGGFLTSAKKG